jgi:hypothetical protein
MHNCKKVSVQKFKKLKYGKKSKFSGKDILVFKAGLDYRGTVSKILGAIKFSGQLKSR